MKCPEISPWWALMITLIMFLFSFYCRNEVMRFFGWHATGVNVSDATINVRNLHRTEPMAYQKNGLFDDLKHILSSRKPQPTPMGNRIMDLSKS